MKVSWVLILCLCLSMLVSLFAFNSNTMTASAQQKCCGDVTQQEEPTADYTYGQCWGTTKNGTRCTRGVSNRGDLYCWQHK